MTMEAGLRWTRPEMFYVPVWCLPRKQPEAVIVAVIDDCSQGFRLQKSERYFQ